MAKPRSGVLELTKRGAAIEYRALVDELKFGGFAAGLTFRF